MSPPSSSSLLVSVTRVTFKNGVFLCSSRQPESWRCSNTAEVRLLRFWEARNVRKNNELMSVDLLLLDEHSTLIHGSINSTRVDTFRGRLNEGSLYSLSGFDVARSNPKFRLSDSPVSIRFGDGTSFEANPDCVV
ncbi:hypothetical protein Rs2_15653 [Raphanus sativus]|nr:hypothetical protein Rs2_15653 [Raphanus sativus]